MSNRKRACWVVVVLGAIALGAATATQITREEFDSLAARVKALEAHVVVLRQQVKNLPHAPKAAVVKAIGKQVKTVVPNPDLKEIDLSKFKWKEIRRLEGVVADDWPGIHEFTASAAWRLRWEAWGDAPFKVSYTDPTNKVRSVSIDAAARDS